ncbi:hypothetical protein ABKA04_010150 [Annulohypoxylon sp. FPYF3050]
MFTSFSPSQLVGPNIGDSDDGSGGSESNEDKSGENESDESDAQLDQSLGSRLARNQAYTISADRTHESEFQQESQILRALRRPNTEQRSDNQRLARRSIPNPRSRSTGNQPSYIPQPENRPAGGSEAYHERLTAIQPPLTESDRSDDSRHIPTAHSNATFDDHFQMIVKALDIPEESVTDLDSLKTYISSFQTTGVHLQPELRSLIIYRVGFLDPEDDQQMYLDRPRWVDGANEKNEALVGNLPIQDITLYLNSNPEVCFTVYRDFPDPSTMKKQHNDAISNPKWQSEVIETANTVLDTALTKFMNSHFFNMDFIRSLKSAANPDSNVLSTGFLEAPYPAIYHALSERGKMDSFLESLGRAQQQQFHVLLDYILSQYEKEYDAVKEITANSRVNWRYLRYLFRPGEVVVQRKGDVVSGFLCSSWVTEKSHLEDKKTLLGKEAEVRKYSMNAYHWGFDGAFSCNTTTLEWEMNAGDTLDMEINGLDIYPLSYARQDLALKLRRRGEMVWKCRTRHLVSYHENANTDQKLHNSGDERYMIDVAMYRQLHPSKSDGKAAEASSSGELHQERSLSGLSPKEMEQSEPPFDKFLYLLPTTIKGFNLRKKRWLDLPVDNLGDVVWNTKAFDSLVLEESTKELIKALVSNQTETERSTDVISGKGNGLILLLHGGPGTGKTLTAESVAETAEKPLYPVTCGDIGTEPEAVENYLESVLHLGKTWGCVVLLDEADVFLEQRSLEDLRRNALVSVFLRVLEYYEGILILTSNRVGTFDEAFKSRIQLSVHYKNLNAEDRGRIWSNFISRLQELDKDGVDFNDLQRNIMLLANYAMNGREIRNVITLARQYTQWKRKQHQNPERCKLNYGAIKSIIETASKFDRYIKQLHGGLSPDQVAEDEGWRIANDATQG